MSGFGPKLRPTLDTQDWYEARQGGLGAVFGAALDQTIVRIAERPLMFPRVHGEIRRAIMNRFPFAVYFRSGEDGIVVLAVHGRQRPRRWQSRT